MPPEQTNAPRSGRLPSSSAGLRSTTGPNIHASRLIAPVLAVIAAVVLWWAIVAIFKIPDYLLPAPEAVAARIVKGGVPCRSRAGDVAASGPHCR